MKPLTAAWTVGQRESFSIRTQERWLELRSFQMKEAGQEAGTGCRFSRCRDKWFKWAGNTDSCKHCVKLNHEHVGASGHCPEPLEALKTLKSEYKISNQQERVRAWHFCEGNNVVTEGLTCVEDLLLTFMFPNESGQVETEEALAAAAGALDCKGAVVVTIYGRRIEKGDCVRSTNDDAKTGKVEQDDRSDNSYRVRWDDVGFQIGCIQGISNYCRPGPA